jgi:mono/diheme cytochrome c family protein
VYLDHCVLCHGTTLSDAQFGSPLRGGYFQSRWHGRNAAELFIITQATMPPEQPMSLAPEEYADVLAYVLQANEIMAGAEDFPADTAALQGMLLPW